MACPELEEARKNLPAVLRHLTNISLESMADLLPERPDADSLMLKHFERVSALCAQIQVDESTLNPRWNKAFGTSSHSWTGGDPDGLPRGGMPYFCPSGWVRFSLNVCPDDEFEDLYSEMSYLYHVTKSKYVGSILTSGLRASTGLSYCGAEEHAVYMSPSIEYCAHPRYGCIEYNPETQRWIQVVLQCRADATKVWKVEPETLDCDEFGLTVDSNIGNDEMEWLFKPNFTDSVTGSKFLSNVIVCTGIMVRVTKEHPLDLSYWWSQNLDYAAHFGLCMLRVDPLQAPMKAHDWTRIGQVVMKSYSFRGNFLDTDFKLLRFGEVNMGKAWMSPLPFGKGSMRFAWYLRTTRGMFVVKSYNQETLDFIGDVLRKTENDAFRKDVATYLVAQEYAKIWNADIAKTETFGWSLNFLEPFIFQIDGKPYFAEKYVKGDFVKWNTNTGDTNMSEDATRNHMHKVASAFSHFTFNESKGEVMVVDLQGFDNPSGVLFTDPQMHTRRFRGGSQDRKVDLLYRRFSLGNLGRTGMIRFFLNHSCEDSPCVSWGMKNPIHDSTTWA